VTYIIVISLSFQPKIVTVSGVGSGGVGGTRCGPVSTWSVWRCGSANIQRPSYWMFMWALGGISQVPVLQCGLGMRGNHIGPKAVVTSSWQWRQRDSGGEQWFASSRTWWVSHTVGLPSNFLPSPSPHAHPKPFEIWPTSRLEGRCQVGAVRNEDEHRGS